MTYDRIDVSRPHYRLLFTAIFASCLVSAFAQTSPPPLNKLPPTSQDQGNKDKDKDKDKPRKRAQTIDEVTKDFTKMDRMVTFYRQNKDKKDTYTWRFRRPLRQDKMLIQITSASGLGDTTAGGVFHGVPISGYSRQVQKVDDNESDSSDRPESGPSRRHRESKVGLRERSRIRSSGTSTSSQSRRRHSVLIDVTASSNRMSRRSQHAVVPASVSIRAERESTR